MPLSSNLFQCIAILDRSKLRRQAAHKTLSCGPQSGPTSELGKVDNGPEANFVRVGLSEVKA